MTEHGLPDNIVFVLECQVMEILDNIGRTVHKPCAILAPAVFMQKPPGIVLAPTFEGGEFQTPQRTV